MNNVSYKKLLTWQKADDLAYIIYSKTIDFPNQEKFGLVSQMRRAALSVPANIAEGYNRISIRDKIHFYIIAEGSLNELEYYIDFSLRLNYLNKNDQLQLMDLKKEVGRLLNGLIKSWRK